MKKRGRKPETIVINGEKFKHDLPEGYSYAAISQKILGKSKSFLTYTFKTGKIKQDDFERICFVFNLNKEDYLPKEEPVIKEETSITTETTVSPTTDSTEITDRLDKLVDVVAKLSETMDALIALQSKQLEKLEVNSLAINELLKVDLDSINTEMAKTNSSLNIIKGRLKDLCDEETEMRKSA